MTKEIAKKWLKQALHDLEMAGRNIDIGGYDIAAFLSHQAVEKLLKAIFALEGREFPRIHYIDELAHQLTVTEEVMSQVHALTADYTLARYPDVSEEVPCEQYDRETAKEKVESAKKVFDLLRGRYEQLEGDDE
ncbi:MAG: HEPN domain-containing protein [Thermoplasmata archaeon]